MVKQRLNQIDPARSPSPRKGLDKGLTRQSSVHSAGGDSLLDLYKDDLATLPVVSRAAWPTTSRLALIPEAPSELETSALQNSPTSMYTAANPDVRLGPLVELLQDQATKHYYHTNDLGDQISSLHSEIREMFNELKVAVGDQPAGEVERFVECINKSMIGLEHRLNDVKCSDGDMGVVKDKLESIHEDIRSYKLGERSNVNLEVLEKLDELRSRMTEQDAVPNAVLHELWKLRSDIAARDEPGEVVLSNLKPSSEAQTSPEVHDQMLELNAKLETLLETWKGLPKEGVREADTAIPEVSKLSVFRI